MPALPSVRILALSDTHLGFDLPLRPRVDRPRRGPELFERLESALAPALRGEVDAVVHGGDVFFRSRVRPSVAIRAFELLAAPARRGTPVILVPGNHERSAIPRRLLLPEGVHVIDRPRTVRLRVRGADVAIVGLPFLRLARAELGRELAASGWRDAPASVRLLCLHQAVEGARVGPVDFTFRRGDDVVRGADIPHGFAAVVSGHIHRHQVLRRTLDGRPFAAPVLFPGSLDRMSFAEKDEPKGYLTLELRPGPAGGRLHAWRFHEMPARPMVRIDVDVGCSAPLPLASRLREALGAVPANAIVHVHVEGHPLEGAAGLLTARALRAMAPPGAIVSAVWSGTPPPHRRGVARETPPGLPFDPDPADP